MKIFKEQRITAQTYLIDFQYWLESSPQRFRKMKEAFPYKQKVKTSLDLI